MTYNTFHFERLEELELFNLWDYKGLRGDIKIKSGTPTINETLSTQDEKKKYLEEMFKKSY
jgi:hypothetical protein